MESRKAVTVLGLAALLVLDIVLIAWALWPSSPSTATDSAMPPTTPSPSATTPDDVDPSGETEAPVGPAPLSRLVAATGPTTAWLVDVGSCDDPGRVHVTVTGGSDWSTQPAPGSVTRIRPDDGSAAFVVGGDADCEAQVWYTGDRGEAWSPPQSADAAWGRHPADAGLVLRPGGEPIRPCAQVDVLDLVGLSRGAASALCADGSIRTTTDSGQSWTTSDQRDGALAISLIAPGDGAVVGVEDACTGVTVSPVADGRLGESSCVEVTSPVAGQVAVSVTEGAVWLVVGDDVLLAEQIDGPYARVSAWPSS